MNKPAPSAADLRAVYERLKIKNQSLEDMLKNPLSSEPSKTQPETTQSAKLALTLQQPAAKTTINSHGDPHANYQHSNTIRFRNARRFNPYHAPEKRCSTLPGTGSSAASYQQSAQRNSADRPSFLIKAHEASGISIATLKDLAGLPRLTLKVSAA
jgi:hypothetical protein